MKLKSIKNPLILYGKNTVQELIGKNLKNIEEFYLVSDDGKPDEETKELKKIIQARKIKISFISKKLADELTNFKNHQGVLVRIKKFQYTPFNQWVKKLNKNKANLVLILDQIDDVNNFGAIIRSAVAFGVSGIIVSEHNQTSVTGAVLKTSGGHAHKIDIINDVNLNQALEKLKNEDFWSYVLVSETEKENQKYKKIEKLSEQKFNGNTVFVIGNEWIGVSQKLKEKADFKVKIGTKNNVENLSSAISASLAIYEWDKQQKKND